MTNEHKCNDFKAPSSLKDLLDFFDKLNGTNGTTTLANGLTIQVLDEIAKRLTGGDDPDKKGWIPDGKIQQFSQKSNDQSSSGGNAFMPEAIKGLKDLRNKILQNGQSNNDNPYTDITKTPASDPCIKKYADAILGNAFPLFGCLFYLWFI